MNAHTAALSQSLNSWFNSPKSQIFVILHKHKVTIIKTCSTLYIYKLQISAHNNYSQFPLLLNWSSVSCHCVLTVAAPGFTKTFSTLHCCESSDHIQSKSIWGVCRAPLSHHHTLCTQCSICNHICASVYLCVGADWEQRSAVCKLHVLCMCLYA